jgi:hypothetical protein
MDVPAAGSSAITIWFRVGSLALPQKINLHNHIFRKALYSTSVRGPSDIWFWIYLLYLTPVFTPVCLEEPLYLYGYTVPVTLRPVIMYTSAKVGDIGPSPKRKAFALLDQKWEAAIKRLSFLGVSARDNSKQ